MFAESGGELRAVPDSGGEVGRAPDSGRGVRTVPVRRKKYGSRIEDTIMEGKSASLLQPSLPRHRRRRRGLDRSSNNNNRNRKDNDNDNFESLFPAATAA